MIETAEPGGRVMETSETMRSGPAGVEYSFERFSTLSIRVDPSYQSVAIRAPLLPNEIRASRIRQFAMSQFDSNKDYYGVLGVDKQASRAEIDRQYKREAAKHHPDRGGSEERMKCLNEAYGVLKDHTLRSSYDAGRRKTYPAQNFTPVATPTARDVGVMGHCLSALLCLIAGVFLLLLVRFQWMFFLWPLLILALFVLGFGILLARSAMVAVDASLPVTSRFKGHNRIQEVAFWTVIVSGGYGLYVVMTL